MTCPSRTRAPRLPQSPGARAAISAHIKGDTEGGLRILRRLEAALPAQSDAEHWYLLSNAYGHLGDHAGCIRTLRMAVGGGFFNYPCFLTDPILDSVRGEPEFQEVLALAKAKHEAFKRKALGFSGTTYSG